MKIDFNNKYLEQSVAEDVNVISIKDMECDEFPLSVEIYPKITGVYMASYMSNSYWTSPFWGKDCADIPEKTQFILWKDGENWHGLFAFADGTCMSRFRGAQGRVVIDVSGGRKDCGKIKSCICLYATEPRPDLLMKKLAGAACRISPIYVKKRTDRRYPRLFDKLGWCSWDAMDINVNSEDVIKKAEEFKQNNIPVGWFILDDMWADVKNLDELEKRAENSLYSFGPDSKRFPGGLKQLADTLKDKYDIDTGVWYTVQGYWSGIDPDGDIAKEMPNDLIYDVTFPHDAKNKRKILRPKSDADSQRHFHDEFCRELRKEGISFVKVDNQSGEERMWEGSECVPYVARNVHGGIESAVGKYFDMNLINCMGMAIQDLWNRPSSAINRNSGDFLPENNRSFNIHAVQNAYNSFAYGEIMWTDWDMWWSDEKNSVKSGVLRGISGGPVYLSDKLGRTKAPNVFPLILSDGAILRFDRPGLPAADILLKNPIEEKIPLKIINHHSDMGAIAVFNMSDESKGKYFTLSLGDMSCLNEDLYIVYEYFSDRFDVLVRGEELNHNFEYADVSAFSLSPISYGFSAIGLKGKYFPCVTIENWFAEKNAMQCTAKDKGTFMFFSKSVPKRVIVNGKDEKYKQKENLYYVELEKEGINNISVII